MIRTPFYKGIRRYINSSDATASRDEEGARRLAEASVDRRKFLSQTVAAPAVGSVLGAGLLVGLNGDAKAAGEPIPIGTMNPLTGPAASDGIAGVYGLELACEEINAMGGILGHPVEPVSVDTKNMSAQEVVSAANLLIDRYGVHSIMSCYNIGPNDAEYEPIADAGIIYMHVNTAIQHIQTVTSNPDRYYGIFMACGPETWYGINYPFLLSRLRDQGLWKPHNNKIAVISGSLPYSIVIANEMKKHSPDYGFEVSFDEVVPVPTTEWGAVLAQVRRENPAAIANTHFFAGDIANCQLQFARQPTNSLMYYQYGALLQSFADIAQDSGVGVLTTSMIAVLPDEPGNAFIEKMKERHGEDVNYDPASYVYSEMWHYAIAAALAGGTAGPGENDQNRRIAANLRNFTYRSVCGSMHYHPEWQSTQPYPVYQKDPSLGLPQPTQQIKDAGGRKEMVFPGPYANGSFEIPSWFS